VTDTPATKWRDSAVVVLAAMTAFMTAYKAFNDTDAAQDAKIDKLAIVICLDTPSRVERCKHLGLLR
jgi:hypothetical protein